MSMRRKNFFIKLVKLFGRGSHVHSKMCPAQMYEERKKQRQQTLLLSHLTQFKPLPTIKEEEEEPALTLVEESPRFYSLAS